VDKKEKIMKLPKDFFQWVFDIMGFSDVKKETQDKWKIDVEGLKNVNRYTRAGKSGKFIYCPVCGEPEIVDNFAWSAMTCPSCRESSDKNDWLVQ
jgi:rubrerythrin